MRTLLIGGPAYNLQSDTRQSQSFLGLQSTLVRYDVGIIGALFEHDALLTLAREKVLRSACATTAEYLLTVDSDTFFEPESLAESMARILPRQDWAFAAAHERTRVPLVQACRIRH